MTLIDDARYDLFFEMIEANDYTGYTWLRCRVCGVDDGKHEDGCTVPRIVAALEAASDLVEAATAGPYPVGGEGPMPPREWRALVKALRGDPSP